MLNLYTETAFQPAPANQSSVLNFDIPRNNGTYDKSKHSSRGDVCHTKNEQDYSAHYLASAADVYFRQNQIAPRCILWRVVESKSVLELQPADVTRSETDVKEAHLTLRFHFQDPLLLGCLAITDTTAHQDIHVFACTSKNEISHLRIPPAAFRQKGTLSSDIGQWASAVEISSLAIHTVYRIYAHTPYELFIAYTSGMVQRVRRKAEGNNWEPENYDDSSWKASFGRMIGRGALRSIEYGSAQIDTRAAQAMIVAADSTYLYTLCLNHHLRVWNLSNGRLAAAKDLLDQDRDSQDRVLLNPADQGHLQLVRASHMKYSILVTFSPHNSGQFKFWDVKGGMTEPLSLEDKYPSLKLSPPDPDPSGSTVWSLTGFYMSPGDLSSPAEIWVLWRNNNFHHLYSLAFEFDNIERSWANDWIACSTTAVKKLASPDLIKLSLDDMTQPWLDFLFTPGRYPAPVIETAISIYSDALSLKASVSSTDSQLRSILCSLIAAGVSLRKYGDSGLDYERFATDTDYQWRNFWRIVENVNDGRNAPIAFAFDPFVTQQWVVMADKCGVVRECSNVELLEQNDTSKLDRLDELCAGRWQHRKVVAEERGFSYRQLATLLTAASSFRRRFPAELAKDLELAFDEEMMTSAERTTLARLYEIYDSVNFADAVSDEIFHNLETELSSVGEVGSLRNDVFLAIIDLYAASHQISRGSNLRSTIFGKSLLAAGTYDCMVRKRQILWDIMAIIVFVEGELNQEDTKMDGFDAAELVEAILPHFRLVERDLWLACRTRSVPLKFGNAHNQVRVPADDSSQSTHVVSVLEDARWNVIEPKPAVDWPQTHILTQTLLEIQNFVSGMNSVDYADGTAFLLGDLITHKEYEAATAFLAFQPSTAWSAYVKARLYLAKKQYGLAAQFFRQASYGLACGRAMGNLTHMSAGLVTPLDAECFYNGLPRYLQHILSLFDASKAYAEAAHFANLTLGSLTPGQKEPTQGFRSETLSRLFIAELKVARYQEAFEALIRFTDRALQKSSATSLIEAILMPQRSAQSVAGAVETLQTLPWSMHPVLSRQLDQQLSKMGKKQKSVPGSIQAWTTPSGSIDYLKLVYTIRTAQNDYRGAVSVLYDRLLLMQKSGRVISDPSATVLRHTLLTLINLMTLVSPDDAYILAEDQKEVNGMNEHVNGGDMDTDSVQPKKRRKVIVTLSDLRNEYQRVLDRCSRVERGDFDFEDGQSDASDGIDVDRSRLDFSGGGRGHGNSMEF